MAVEVHTGRVLISKLFEAVESYLSSEAQQTVYAAYILGAEAHEDQFRQDGTPYIYHPMSVALILAGMKMDCATLSAAILHDVIEDTAYTREQIADQFGEDVAALVDGVSKISQIASEDKVHSEAASFRKMLMAMAKDVRVMLIKLADRLHNMHTLGSLRPEKQQRIARQTLEIYAPIANRLGMREMHAELEDICFKTLYPARYKAIKEKLDKDTRGRKPAVELICSTLQQKFIEAKIKNADIKGRQKRIYSIYQKMRDRSVPMGAQRDIHGIRIIVGTREECYQALGIVHKAYIPVFNALKDYIGMPKDNGYRSLHTVVIGPHGQAVEVQIRSVKMDRIAESGVAAHWIYKRENKSSQPPQRIVNKWLQGFLDSQLPVGNSGHFMEHLRAEMFPDKLFVFTPKGDIKRLPVGSTAVDFAYAVHSGVGNACVQATINDEQMPLHTVLESGDSIKIKTSPTGRPLPAWLNFVVTSKARTSIRHYLNQQQDKEAISMGRKLLTRALRESGFKGSHVSSQHKVDLLKLFNLKDWNQLLMDIGFGRRLPLMVAQQLISLTNLDVDKTSKPNSTSLSIRGAEKLLINYAACCYPLPDENIIGVFAAGKGLVVHTADCPNTKRLRKQRDRWLHLDWSKTAAQKFKSRLSLEVKHQPGTLASVSQVFASHKSNILKVNVSESDPDFANMDFEIEVENLQHLDRIIHSLQANENMLRVYRVKG